MNTPTAIITGAGRGIGRATAIELSRRGFAVVLVARREADLIETARLCDPACRVRADVADEDAADRIAGAALEFTGRIDVLVNNAGYAPILSIEQTTPDEWRRVIDVNLTAPYLLSRACWPTFLKQSSGVIVNVSSLAARDPLPGFLAYGAAKAGLNVLGLTLAREGAPAGIRVHTIAPGAVETEMFRSLVDEKTWPTDRTMEPGQVAGVIAACADGTLAHASGEVIWIKRNP
jgi:hypothetical protein